MRIEFWKGELIRRGVVHGNKYLAGLNDGSDEGARGDGSASGSNGDLVAVADFQAMRIVGIDFNVDAIGIKAAQDGGFAGARLGVPLGGAAATGEQREWIFGVGSFRGRSRVFEDEAGFAVGMEEPSVGEEAALLSGADVFNRLTPALSI
jgi:hypothetical protein